MSVFQKIDNKVFLTSQYGSEYFETPPSSIYTLNFSNLQGFYLSQHEKFIVPDKIYGNENTRVARVMKTYQFLFEKNKSLGVLASGIKGSGKTLLVKNIANEIIKQNGYVVLIQEGYLDTTFLKFIEELNGKCCVIFDEFEKLYKDQKNLLPILTLLDGTSVGNKLFLFTSNYNHYDLNEYLVNRPGRIRYSFNYKNLDMSVVEDYCKDKNVPNDIISEIKVVARFASEFSFDILKCLVEEYFIHKISIVELIKDFNIKLFNKETKYNVSIETIKPTSDNKVLIFEDSNKQIVNVEGIYPDTKSYIIYCELVGENEEQNSFVNINVAADNCKTDWENYKPEKYKTLINYKEGIFELTWNKIVRNEEASIFGKKILFKELLACNDV